MYSEKTYKNYIFWVQVKRVIVVILLSCLGAGLGILIGKILESTIKLTSFNNIIIAVSTTIFFLLGLLLTVGTGKQVQDGYWRIAVLRKLTVIQKSLELNNELLKNANKSVKSNISPIVTDVIDKVNIKNNIDNDLDTVNTANSIKEEVVTDAETDTEMYTKSIYNFEETALVPQKKVQKKKVPKKKKILKSFRKPEEV